MDVRQPLNAFPVERYLHARHFLFQLSLIFRIPYLCCTADPLRARSNKRAMSGAVLDAKTLDPSKSDIMPAQHALSLAQRAILACGRIATENPFAEVAFQSALLLKNSVLCAIAAQTSGTSSAFLDNSVFEATISRHRAVASALYPTAHCARPAAWMPVLVHCQRRWRRKMLGVAGNKLRVCEVDDANQHRLGGFHPNVSGDIAGDAMVIDLCNEKVSVSRVSDGKHADIVISSGSQDTPMRIRVDQWTQRDRLWMILKRYTYQSFVIHCMTRIPRARRAEIHAATLMIKGHNSETEQRFLFAMSPKHSAGTSDCHLKVPMLRSFDVIVRKKVTRHAAQRLVMSITTDPSSRELRFEKYSSDQKAFTAGRKRFGLADLCGFVLHDSVYEADIWFRVGDTPVFRRIALLDAGDYRCFRAAFLMFQSPSSASNWTHAGILNHIIRTSLSPSSNRIGLPLRIRLAESKQKSEPQTESHIQGFRSEITLSQHLQTLVECASDISMLSLSINAIVRAATESVEGVKRDRKILACIVQHVFLTISKGSASPNGPKIPSPGHTKRHKPPACRCESGKCAIHLANVLRYARAMGVLRAFAAHSDSECRQWALKAAWGIHSLSGAPCHGKLKRISTHRRAGGCADAFINFSAVVIHACGTGRIDAGVIHVLFEVMLGSVTAKVSSFEIEEFYAHIRESEVIPLLLRALHAAPESIAVQGMQKLLVLLNVRQNREIFLRFGGSVWQLWLMPFLDSDISPPPVLPSAACDPVPPRWFGKQHRTSLTASSASHTRASMCSVVSSDDGLQSESSMRSEVDAPVSSGGHTHGVGRTHGPNKRGSVSRGVTRGGGVRHSGQVPTLLKLATGVFSLLHKHDVVTPNGHSIALISTLQLLQHRERGMSKCVKDSIQSEGRVRVSHDDGKNSAHRGSDSSRSDEKARRSDTSMTVDSSLAVYTLARNLVVSTILALLHDSKHSLEPLGGSPKAWFKVEELADLMLNLLTVTYRAYRMCALQGFAVWEAWRTEPDTRVLLALLKVLQIKPASAQSSADVNRIFYVSSLRACLASLPDSCSQLDDLLRVVSSRREESNQHLSVLFTSIWSEEKAIAARSAKRSSKSSGASDVSGRDGVVLNRTGGFVMRLANRRLKPVTPQLVSAVRLRATAGLDRCPLLIVAPAAIRCVVRAAQSRGKRSDMRPVSSHPGKMTDPSAFGSAKLLRRPMARASTTSSLLTPRRLSEPSGSESIAGQRRSLLGVSVENMHGGTSAVMPTSRGLPGPDDEESECETGNESENTSFSALHRRCTMSVSPRVSTSERNPSPHPALPNTHADLDPKYDSRVHHQHRRGSESSAGEPKFHQWSDPRSSIASPSGSGAPISDDDNSNRSSPNLGETRKMRTLSKPASPVLSQSMSSLPATSPRSTTSGGTSSRLGSPRARSPAYTEIKSPRLPPPPRPKAPKPKPLGKLKIDRHRRTRTKHRRVFSRHMLHLAPNSLPERPSSRSDASVRQGSSS